jgi:hypothetical protein
MLLTTSQSASNCAARRAPVDEFRMLARVCGGPVGETFVELVLEGFQKKAGVVARAVRRQHPPPAVKNLPADGRNLHLPERLPLEIVGEMPAIDNLHKPKPGQQQQPAQGHPHRDDAQALSLLFAIVNHNVIRAAPV